METTKIFKTIRLWNLTREAHGTCPARSLARPQRPWVKAVRCHVNPHDSLMDVDESFFLGFNTMTNIDLSDLADT